MEIPTKVSLIEKFLNPKKQAAKKENQEIFEINNLNINPTFLLKIDWVFIIENDQIKPNKKRVY